MPGLTKAEQNAKDWLVSEGHQESEIVRRYGSSPSFYLIKNGTIVRAFEPKLIFGANEVFLTPNELEELRACEYNAEIIVFKKNSPAKPQLSIPISALTQLGTGKSTVKFEEIEVTLLPEQMLVRDKRTIRALAVVPKYVLDNLRFVYELGDAERKNAFLKFLSGTLKEISLETLTPESYKQEVQRILDDNAKKIERDKQPEESRSDK